MKRFLIQTILFLLLVTAAFAFVLSRAGCSTDEFYCRFTSPQQHSLILGTSRSAQGIDPSILNKTLGRNDVFNYSFTNEHSPYGKVYLESIKQKLSKDTKDGIFILSVDPWNLGADKTDPNDESKFRENGLMLSNMWSVSTKPNFFYLLKYYEGSYINLLTGKGDKQLQLRENGWLEVTVPMDSASVAKRTLQRVKLYRDETAPNYAFSSTRLKYLKETISYLKEYGRVYLVRLPVSNEMLEIENVYDPNFKSRMMDLSKSDEVPFLDLTEIPAEIAFTDGNHIAKSSVPTVTEQIAAFISKNANGY